MTAVQRLAHFVVDVNNTEPPSICLSITPRSSSLSACGLASGAPTTPGGACPPTAAPVGGDAL